MDEHVRHRAVERLESQVARDEAVTQVARAVDVDVAHRVVVGPRKDREEVERWPLAKTWILWMRQAGFGVAAPAGWWRPCF